MAALRHSQHVLLPTDIDPRLKAEPERSGQSRAVLVRQAIEVWLAERDKEALHDAIGNFARSTAGTPADLDTTLECVAADYLLHGGQEDA
ncbi:MAG: hypothetical protein OXU42_14835 [Deltaproteobacteria bacterium]|nr:hypothetical protein [Deltaproteobacteria bacterium]